MLANMYSKSNWSLIQKIRFTKFYSIQFGTDLCEEINNNSLMSFFLSAILMITSYILNHKTDNNIIFFLLNDCLSLLKYFNK